MRTLTFDERLLLAVQKDPSLGYNSFPSREGFNRRFRELGIPETSDDVVSVESIVASNLVRFIKKPE